MEQKKKLDQATLTEVALRLTKAMYPSSVPTTSSDVYLTGFKACADRVNRVLRKANQECQ